MNAKEYGMMNQDVLRWGLANQSLFPQMSAATGMVSAVSRQVAVDGGLTDSTREQMSLAVQELALACQAFDDAPPVPGLACRVLMSKALAAWRVFLDCSANLETVDEFEAWGNASVVAEEAWSRAMDAIGVAVGS